MDFVGSRYYELNRILLLSVGLWPYDKSVFKRIKILVSLGSLLSCNVVMIAKIITSKCDAVITLRILSIAIPGEIIIFKYITFLLLSAGLRKIMERVQNDWNALKDSKELDVIRKYTHHAWLFTVAVTVFGCACACGLALMLYLPDILDVLMQQNTSHVQRLPVEAEYFVDREKYFYIMFWHMYISTVLGIAISLATETLYVAYIHHACGMFKITSYRLQWAFDQDIPEFTEDVIVRTRIIDAIEMHKRALKFFDTLWSELGLSYFILLLIGMASFTINMFRIFWAIIANNIEELLTSVMCIIGHLIYLFFGSYAGQAVIDHSTDIHENVYDTQWYRVSPRQRKLILFILHRSSVGCRLITGGMFVLSLEGFTTLIAMSISYFTLLSSVQN